MASLVLIAIVGIIFLYRIYKYCFYRPENWPPGPPRIPFVGSYFMLFLLDFKNLHIAVQKLCKYYKSDVVGFYVGNTFTIATNSQETVREVLFNPDFDGRNDGLLVRLRNENFNRNGIFFIDNPYWQDQRRFTLRNLRDFGFGRRFEEYEIEVKNEIENFINLIKEGPKYSHEMNIMKSDGSILLPKALIACMSNCFLQIVANVRIQRSEQEKLFKAGFGSFEFQFYSDEYGKSFGIFPWLRYLLPNLSRYTNLRNGSMKMFNFMKEFVDKQIATYEEGHIRSFMDTYIKEINEADGKDRGYLYDQMVMICTDFLFPSLSAIEIQVSFLLKHLLYHNDIMIKIQEEIDDVVGQGRLPSLDDRINLHYTEATLRESGYDIPKDSSILPSLFSLHTSKQVWKDPENFRPERFLNLKGQLCLKYDKSLPFGGGRRLCAGETFARNTMFLLFASLLQNFNVKPANGVLPKLDDDDCGLVRIPKDFWIKLESR
ncbi:hypothetical protein PVAND_000181 [Polypedilum vanderplanki]|uniref:Cytochrome P450 n=1 Tax=Polypedilum vanderplanki TaxID=319348 RepID=A0A9J6BJJ4_POLVA|nr:hypothetical protein PVAND_000181 [Polypedilum vanderplanki]